VRKRRRVLVGRFFFGRSFSSETQKKLITKISSLLLFHFYTNKRTLQTQSSKMVDVNAVPSLWEEFRKDQVNWVLFTYGDNNTIVEAGKGNGGFAEFKTHLKEDGIFYGGFRVMAVGKLVFVTDIKGGVLNLKI
jgi:hypothetical protein